VEKDDVTHTANVSLQVKEIGQQTRSLSAESASSDLTLGIIYTSSILSRERFHFDTVAGGPESCRSCSGWQRRNLATKTRERGFLGV